MRRDKKKKKREKKYPVTIKACTIRLNDLYLSALCLFLDLLSLLICLGKNFEETNKNTAYFGRGENQEESRGRGEANKMVTGVPSLTQGIVCYDTAIFSPLPSFSTAHPN